MLFNCAQDKAVQYLGEVLDQVSSMGEILQFIVVELIRKVCRQSSAQDRVHNCSLPINFTTDQIYQMYILLVEFTFSCCPI